MRCAVALWAVLLLLGGADAWKDLYAVMNLTNTATQKEIKRMYQKWARMLHPDVTKWPKDVARTRMIEVTEAYEILSDEERRTKYDSEGTMDIGTDANTEWKRSRLFAGTHDAFTFKNEEDIKRAKENHEDWIILFWGKNYPECTEASVVWSKFATRMKGVVNIGTLQCDDMGHVCRSFGLRNLPAVYTLRKGKPEPYRGKIEVQTLVDFAADNMLKHADKVISSYVPGMLAISAPLQPALEKLSDVYKYPTSSNAFIKPPAASLRVEEVWQLVTFEYTDCMDCRTEMKLAVETLHTYTPGGVRAIRVDCTKKKNRNFCSYGKKDKSAWRVAHVRRHAYYTPVKNKATNELEWKHLKTSPLEMVFLESARQWSARDVTSFVFSHQPTSVIRLTARAFQRLVLHSIPAWAILFTASDPADCAGCRAFGADWEIMARLTKGYISPKGTALRVASLDCSKHRAFCSSFGIAGKLPALRMYRGGIKAKEDAPHELGVQDPPSMLAECKREMEPLKIVDMDMPTFREEVHNVSGKATKPNHWFILFNAGTWCPPCQNMKQPWKDMSRILSDNPKNKVKVAQVDCDTNGMLCNSENIQNYPTMAYYPQGKKPPVFYNGDRRAEAMAEWIDGLIDNRVIQLGRSAIELAKSRKNPIIIAFSAGDWCPPCTALKGKWKTVADLLYPMKVATVDCDNNQNVCSRFGIKGYPTVALYPNGPDKRGRVVIYDGDKNNPSAIAGWAKSHMPWFTFKKPPQ
eukprot:Sspe_Gene.93390::Locus_66043_Transcript_1_1_Confidence_1.000_Length_2321::g.93390::m.93390/K09530/DNAJC10; DnaJ homolog subfamily C member 10